MAVLEIRFLSGHYHATAWGRNVNEGEPEWPPSPHRLARALLDIWYRRHPELSEQDVKQALLLLTGQPRMVLPSASTMAVKLYQDQNKKDPDKQPVLDAFICVEKGASAFIELPECASEAALHTLDVLAKELNYLGRSESWVEVTVSPCLPDAISWNCCASQSGTVVNVLLSEEQYADLPYLPKTGTKKKLRDCTWMETLTLSTADLQKAGWNRHPLLSKQHYSILSEHCSKTTEAATEQEGLIVTYALHAKPLPPITEAVTVAERVRAGLMSRHRQICCGDESRVSPLFSGKDAAGLPLKGQQHAFYWPCDLDSDGKIDHIRVVLPRAVNEEELRALETLRKLWVGREDLGELVYLHAVPMSQFPTATEVESFTPVVFGRHYKPGKGSRAEWLEAEIRRSCVEMGLPEPVAVYPKSSLAIGDEQRLAWMSFRRNRKERSDIQGFGFRLVFSSPVRVPFALGSLAHFGLGFFKENQKRN